MKKQILAAVGTVWLLFIGIFWFHEHIWRDFGAGAGDQLIQFGRMWATSMLGQILTPLLLVLLAVAIYILWRWMWHGQSELKMKLSLPKLAGIGFVTGLIMWNAAAFLRDMPGLDESPILVSDFWAANGHFIWNFISIIAWLALVLLLLRAAGALVLRLFHIDWSSHLAKFLFSCATGIGLWSLLLMAAAWADWHFWWVAAALAVIFAALSWRDLYSDIKTFFTHKWEWRSSFWDLAFILALLWLAMLMMNLVDLIRPIPIGWDDLGTYLNRAKNMSESHSLLAGGVMFPMEVLMSVGYFISQSATWAMVISWAGGFLGSVAVFAFGKRFWDARVGIIAAAIWYTLPMVIHISSADMKVDPTLFFVSTLALWGVLEWLSHKYDRKWLYLAMLLVGIAWTIKITTAFLMVGVAAIIIWQLWKWRATWIEKVKTLALAAVIFLIPFAPWFLYNMSTNEWQMPASLTAAVNSMSEERVRVTDAQLMRLNIDPASCRGTGGVEEEGRYTGNLAGLKKYVLMPWYLTMNTHINDLYLIIGFLFLGIVPLWLLFADDLKKVNQVTVALMLFGAVYWIFWAWKGAGIPWYGIVGFLPLCLAVATFFEKITAPRWFHIVIGTAILVSVLANMTLRLERFGNYAIVQYAGGRIDHAQFIETILPDYNRIAAAIDSSPTPVWRVGTFIPYFVENSTAKLMSDNQLDVFSCIDQGGIDDARTLDNLRRLGYQYIVLDLNVATIESDPTGTLHQKADRFVQFANKNLNVLVNNMQRGIAFMEIPAQ